MRDGDEEMITATRLTYGQRINGDHMRYCSVCGCQRATERGKFIEHQTPSGKPCENSGKSVNKVNTEAIG